MPTILITGCSSGFGLETARLFLERDWNVIATMRTPREEVLPRSDRLRVLSLDVRDPASIQRCVEAAGPIDALVNNAGVGLLSLVEGTPMDTTRATFETNTFGAIAMTRAVLPQLRARRGGVIVNVSSSTTLKPLPMLAIYTASKAALEAFTACLALELAPFGVRTRLVVPGRAPSTSFGTNARAQMEAQGVAVPDAYAGFAQEVLDQMMTASSGPVTRPTDVAEAVWTAVSDPTSPSSLPAGADAVALAQPR